VEKRREVTAQSVDSGVTKSKLTLGGRKKTDYGGSQCLRYSCGLLGKGIKQRLPTKVVGIPGQRHRGHVSYTRTKPWKWDQLEQKNWQNNLVFTGNRGFY